MFIPWKCLAPATGLAAGFTTMAFGLGSAEIVVATIVSGADLIASTKGEKRKHGPEREDAIAKIVADVEADLVREVKAGLIDLADLETADAVLADLLPRCLLDRGLLAEAAVHETEFATRATQLVLESLAARNEMFSPDADTRKSRTWRSFAERAVRRFLSAALDDLDYVQRLQPRLMQQMGQTLGQTARNVAEVLAIVRHGDPGPPESHVTASAAMAAPNQLPRTVMHGAPGVLAVTVDRPAENHKLHEAVQTRTATIVVVSGIGGQGKTTLVSSWMKKQAALLPFEISFYFSAYRFQADYRMFLEELLAELEPRFAASADTDEFKLARMLLDALSRRKILIVIDGMERWLRGWSANDDLERIRSEDDAGESDNARGLDQFLEGLTSLGSGTRVILTTRAVPRALKHLRFSAVEAGGSGSLGGLQDREGYQLLTRLGVRGDRREIERCSRDYQGHPLALTVLAGLLGRHGGDIAERHDLSGDITPSNTRLKRLFLGVETQRPGDVPLLGVAALCFGDAPIAALMQIVAPEVSPRKIVERFMSLRRWGLVTLNGEQISLHPLVKQHFAASVPDKDRVHHDLAAYFRRSPISDKARSISRVQQRIWAIQHAEAAGNADEACRMLFDPMNSTGCLAEWFPRYGHLRFEIGLEERLQAKATGSSRRRILNSLSQNYAQLGQIQKARELVRQAIAIGGGGA